MIVERRTFLVKTMREQEVVDLVKAGIEANTTFTGAYRIYVSDIGPGDVVAVEWEYEDLEEMQAVWDAWETNLANQEFWEAWGALTERGGEREVWQLAAKR
jgi:hypothetical protein